MDALWLSTALGFAIGLVLGLLGGGGSILTVPALVYLIGQTPQVAVTTSLMIVGANSMVGAMFRRTTGDLNWRVAVLFGGVGMFTAYFAAGLSKLFAPTTLLVLFSLLMLLVGVIMLARPNYQRAENRPVNLMTILLAGAVVGLLTGLLGVGGGFLIVPALVMLVGLPMRQAVGTSLVIIAMNSLAGLLGHIGDPLLDLRLVVIFLITGLAGTFVGTKLTKVIPPKQLQRLFALFVIVLAVSLLVDNAGKMG